MNILTASSSMDLATRVIIVLGLVVVVGLAISLATIIKILRIWRTPTTWISALPSDGPVEVTGKTGTETFLSPISKAPCIAYQMQVEEESRSKKGTTSWSTIRKVTSEQAFPINDGTGVIYVDPSHADIVVNDELRTDSFDLSGENNITLENMGIKTTNLFGSMKTLRVTERLVAREQQIFVSGAVQQIGGKKVIAGKVTTPLVITDRNEQELLKALYWRVGKNLLYCLLGGVVLFFILQSFR